MISAAQRRLERATESVIRNCSEKTMSIRGTDRQYAAENRIRLAILYLRELRRGLGGPNDAAHQWAGECHIVGGGFPMSENSGTVATVTGRGSESND
jgi:hypothetical protein